MMVVEEKEVEKLVDGGVVAFLAVEVGLGAIIVNNIGQRVIRSIWVMIWFVY